MRQLNGGILWVSFGGDELLFRATVKQHKVSSLAAQKHAAWYVRALRYKYGRLGSVQAKH